MRSTLRCTAELLCTAWVLGGGNGWREQGPRSEAFGGHVGAQHQWERHAWGEGEAAGAGEDDTALEAALRNMYRQVRSTPRPNLLA
jgi:hypothetical protein